LRHGSAQWAGKAAHDVTRRARTLHFRVGAEGVEHTRRRAHALFERRVGRNRRRRQLPADIAEQIAQLTIT